MLWKCFLGHLYYVHSYRTATTNQEKLNALVSLVEYRRAEDLELFVGELVRIHQVNGDCGSVHGALTRWALEEEDAPVYRRYEITKPFRGSVIVEVERYNETGYASSIEIKHSDGLEVYAYRRLCSR